MMVERKSPIGSSPLSPEGIEDFSQAASKLKQTGSRAAAVQGVTQLTEIIRKFNAELESAERQNKKWIPEEMKQGIETALEPIFQFAADSQKKPPSPDQTIQALVAALLSQAELLRQNLGREANLAEDYRIGKKVEKANPGKGA